MTRDAIQTAREVARLSAWKDPVVIAVAGSTPRSGLQLLQGVQLVAGDRVLVVDGVNAGVWIASSGAWGRSEDTRAQGSLRCGVRIAVESGDDAGLAYKLSTANPILVGTTSQTWELDQSGGGGGISNVIGTAPIAVTGATTKTVAIAAASGSVAGSMASADFTKLAGVESGAQVTSTARVLTALAAGAGSAVTIAGTTVTLTGSGAFSQTCTTWGVTASGACAVSAASWALTTTGLAAVNGLPFDRLVRASATTNVANIFSAPGDLNSSTGITFNISESEADRTVLLTGQSTPNQNGPWVWQGAGTTMVRPSWFDAAGEAVQGMVLRVCEGTNASTHWQLATAAVTVGVTAQTWTKIGGSGGGGGGDKIEDGSGNGLQAIGGNIVTIGSVSALSLTVDGFSVGANTDVQIDATDDASVRGQGGFGLSRTSGLTKLDADSGEVISVTCQDSEITMSTAVTIVATGQASMEGATAVITGTTSATIAVDNNAKIEHTLSAGALVITYKEPTSGADALVSSRDVTASSDAFAGNFTASVPSAGTYTISTPSGKVVVGEGEVELRKSAASTGQLRFVTAGEVRANNGGLDLTAAAGAMQLTTSSSFAVYSASFALNANSTKYVEANSTGLGFFAATPVAKPTVTGSKTSGAAWVSLLAALVSLGLVTDSTSA